MRLILALILTTLMLSACANKGLHDLRTNQAGPDEFIILPQKPLEQPASYTSLPTPTPGQSNLTDTYPLQDAVVAVGGRPQADTGVVPSGDAALVQAASRFGGSANIRETLAVEDAEFRRKKARLTQYRIVPVDSYNEAYKREALNARRAAERWREAGAGTPSFPPVK